jgi:hypothetical protein
MRSESVVLPESMWAEIPIFLVLAKFLSILICTPNGLEG